LLLVNLSQLILIDHLGRTTNILFYLYHGKTCQVYIGFTQKVPQSKRKSMVHNFQKNVILKTRVRNEQTPFDFAQDRLCRVGVNFIFYEGLGASFRRAHRHSEKWREARRNRLL